MSNIRVTAERIDHLMDTAKFESTTLFEKCTVVAAQLENGFVLVESSACVDPENYDFAIGYEACKEAIRNKVWMLEGYSLQDRVHWGELFNRDHCHAEPVALEATTKKAEPKVKVKLDEGAYMPTRAHAADAGLDIYAMEGRAIAPNHFVRIKTGVHVAIPEGYVGMMTSKSGLMRDHGLTCRGTIDSGYTGAIEAIIFNHSDFRYEIKPGDKIAQMVLVPIITPGLELVDELEETERGDNGFGSTGR